MLHFCSFDIYWARICKRLSSPGIDYKESIPPGWAPWKVYKFGLFTSTCSVACTESAQRAFVLNVQEFCKFLHSSVKKKDRLNLGKGMELTGDFKDKIELKILFGNLCFYEYTV